MYETSTQRALRCYWHAKCRLPALALDDSRCLQILLKRKSREGEASPAVDQNEYEKATGAVREERHASNSAIYRTLRCVCVSSGHIDGIKAVRAEREDVLAKAHLSSMDIGANSQQQAREHICCHVPKSIRGRDRTCDPRLRKAMLYPLSHADRCHIASVYFCAIILCLNYNCESCSWMGWHREPARPFAKNENRSAAYASNAYSLSLASREDAIVRA